MKSGLLFLVMTLGIIYCSAQERCASTAYTRQLLQNDPALADKILAIEKFAANRVQLFNRTETTTGVIKIPVVVHILYHTPDERISDALVFSQIEALNKCFRRMNEDTVNTPAIFKPLAADCEIEFQLATSDPKRRSTNGIIRKYTPIKEWVMDDKMKFAGETGSDAWDTKSYLNIWVCNMDRLAGYSSLPGGEENKDGVVIDISAFGVTNLSEGYGLGRTAVHEVGHWLNLRHLWGDEYCGDDGVNDTPKQASYNFGCPSGVRITCNNSPTGDMYTNYMDFTRDICVNLFTLGQKERMRALFEPGGVRNALLFSRELSTPLIFESPLPDEQPRWLHLQLYPNPVRTELTLDLAYDERWIGKTIFITSLSGQTVMNVMITSKNQRIDVSRLQPGMYFLAAKKTDGESMKLKFIKL